MRGWLDTNVYEALIPPSIQLNETIMTINLTMTQYFRYQVNCNTDCIISDISFHLKSTHPYFYLASENKTLLKFVNDEEMFVPIMVESVKLLSANNGYIPLNDYRMSLEVISGDTSLLISDIIIHVVEPLPALPVSGLHSIFVCVYTYS